MDPVTKKDLATRRWWRAAGFSQRGRPRDLKVAALCLAAAGALLIGFRLHAFNLPLETDECNYAYIAGRLLAGDRLYLDVWDHQPFGVFALFAGVIVLLGDAPEVFRWMATFFSLVSMTLVYLILRRVAGSGAAIAGAFLFATASSDPGTAGEGCNREIYMSTLILLAWYCALQGAIAPSVSVQVPCPSRRRGHESCQGGSTRPRSAWPWHPGMTIFLAGCALAVASSLKTIVAVHWLFLAAWIAVGSAVRTRAKGPHGGPYRVHLTDWKVGPTGCVGSTGTETRVRSVAVSLALFAAGPLLLWLAAFAYFGVTGRLNEFVDAVFLFNVSYSGSSEGFLVRFVRFFAPERHPHIFDSALPLWIGAMGATAWLIVEAFTRRSRDALAIVLLVFSAYTAVCLPSRFWPHYYYLLIPALVIAVLMVIARLVALLRDSGVVKPSGLRIASFALFALFPITLFTTEYRDYLRQPPFGVTVKRYNSRDFWGRAQGENVRRVTDPDDEIFVFGNDAEIYYYARRRCASRYTMITGLHAGMAGARQRCALMMADLERRLPRLILVLFDEDPFEEWKAFLDRYYGEPIGWDFHDRSREPIMLVLARKDRPVKKINWDWDRLEVGGWLLGEKP